MAERGLSGRCERPFPYPRPRAWALLLLALWAGAAAANPAAADPAPGDGASAASGARRAGASPALDGRPVLEIQVLGNVKTRVTTILRELFLQPGDAYDAGLLARDLEFLRGLGLFAEVTVETLPSPEGVKLVYRVVERGELRFGLVYPIGELRDEKIQLGLVYRHRSIFGGREGFYFEGSTGREERLELRVSRPWLGSLPLEHSLGFDYVDRQEDNPYKLLRVALGFWISLDPRRPHADRFLFSGVVGRRVVELEEGGSLTEWVDAVALGYSRDSRNSFLKPSAGGYFRITGSLYDPKLGSSVSLLQTSFWLSRYRALGRGWIGALALSSSNQFGTLFYKGVHSLGGMDNIRGYRSGHLRGWFDSGTGEGKARILNLGRHRILIHGELRHDLLPPFTFDLPFLGVVDLQGAGVLFADGGYLWNRDLDALPEGADELSYGFGLGLRIYTGIGDVLRAEFGLAEAGHYRLHLGSGLGF